MSDFLKLIGERIRSLRKEKGLTQEALAEKSDIHYSYIGGIERGDRNISLATLEKIINALEITPVELFQFHKTDIETELLDKRMLIEAHRSLLINLSMDEVKLIHRIAKDIATSIGTHRNQS
ncbi:helix-turn-helix transcriptional regulator [Brevibacillus gelatini]|uniref:helix-turn-helix domain-containing protein n=1 Tax=Brevibacillus gelatini TaxID=1655277 RepID=UPI003D818157